MKLKQKGYILILSAFIATISLFSCSDGDLSQGRRDTIGQVDDVVFVCTNQMWNTDLQDTIFYYFESPFLILPQPEPIFRVKHFSMQQILEKPIRKKFANMVLLANMSDMDTREAKMALKDLGEERVNEVLNNPVIGFATGKDKWADNQLVVYILGNSQEDLERSVVKHFPKIAAKIRQNDEVKRQKRVFYGGENQGVKKILLDTFNISMKIPATFVSTTTKKAKGLLWIHKNTEKVNSNILITKIPYKHENQLNPDTLQSYLNKIGRNFIVGDTEGSYFVINDHDLPLIKNKVNLNGQLAMENRGIWELTIDPMGGPFVSYLLQNPNNKSELLLITGFVYAPQKKKKIYMEDLEEIIRSIK